MDKSRSWCFTSFEEMDFDIGDYTIVGREKCPTTGTMHYQGFIYFKNARSFSSVKKKLGDAHIEKCRGSIEDNIKYCSKDGEFVEYGIRPSQGKRVDLLEIKKKIDNGENIIDEHFDKWCIYRRAFDEYIQRKEPKRNWVTNVIWLYGCSGVGKSREAVAGGATMLEYDGKYIGNYNGEDIVCFDDCDHKTFENRQFWLKLLDRYEMNVRVIGGYRNWKPKTIYITSNYSPKDLELDQAFQRRITNVKFLTQ